jgi:LPS sulfotransferase NodH
MLRHIVEVVASQRAMTTRLGAKGASLDTEHLERGLRAHREEVRKWATNAPHIEWLEIDYPALVRDPAPALSRLVEFLGRERLPNDSKMGAVIDPALHRERT